MLSPFGPHSRFVENGGVRLHYLDLTPDDGRPPLLLVPGLTDTADDYAPALRLFGRRTVIAELRGRGRSDAPATGYTFEDQVSDVGAIIDDAGLKQFHLATFSRGTGYALGWLVQHPDRVISLTIGDHLVNEVGPEPGWAKPFYTGRWRGRPVLDRLAEAALTGIEREAIVYTPMWDELAAAAIPLQLVRAGRPNRDGSRSVTDEGVATYRATFPEIEIVTLDESDHDLLKPDPDRFPNLIAAFARRHDPADG